MLQKFYLRWAGAVCAAARHVRETCVRMLAAHFHALMRGSREARRKRQRGAARQPETSTGQSAGIGHHGALSTVAKHMSHTFPCSWLTMKRPDAW
eukprot:352986-Chlamydomonas_euryale.AAC.7